MAAEGWVTMRPAGICRCPDGGHSVLVLRETAGRRELKVRLDADEARVDALMSENVNTMDMAERRRTWAEIQNTINEECFIIWLPSIVYKVPIRNRFGNVHPTVIPHRIIWNIDKVFVKPNPTRA